MKKFVHISKNIVIMTKYNISTNNNSNIVQNMIVKPPKRNHEHASISNGSTFLLN